MQQEGYNLSDSFLSGASAGALSATLAKMNVCPLRATELALSLSDDADVWERPLGLQGVWGNLIYEWLNQLVPEDAEERLKKGGEVGGALYASYHSRSFNCSVMFITLHNAQKSPLL